MITRIQNWFRTFLAAWRMRRSFDPVLLARVHVLVHDLDQFPHSGEWKRHTVYSKLLKEYPTMPHHTLALAIEVALCS